MDRVDKLAAEIRSQLFEQSSFDANLIGVHVSGDTVTLNGVVPSFWARIYAEQLTGSFPDVHRVDNRLEVRLETARSDDAIIHEIKENLRLTDSMDPTVVNVEVNAGRVRLWGTVAGDSAKETAFKYAANTQGVRDVQNDLVVRKE